MIQMPPDVAPSHIGSDVWLLIPKADRGPMYEIHRAQYADRMALLMNSELLIWFGCWLVKKGCCCARAGVHVACTPCVHDSLLGPLSEGGRDGNHGEHAWILQLFARQRRQ